MNRPDEAPHAIERLAQVVQSLAENDQMINGRLDELFGVLEKLTEPRCGWRNASTPTRLRRSPRWCRPSTRSG
jgi:plasmid stabilization system protein ParE